MHIRFLEYFVALADERHFARAARRCNVSQPALSTGLVALEQRLGKRLVERDRRFESLTREGEAILPWAQQIVAAAASLAMAATGAQGPLTGLLRIGIVPAAQPVAGFFTRALKKRHPALELSYRALTSDAISRALETFEIDAGLTYVSRKPAANVVSVPLYEERLVFMSARHSKMIVGSAISPAQAVSYPLCLLHEGMQNRRILDEQLAAANLIAAPVATTDSHETLISMTATGSFATVLPDSYGLLLPDWAVATPFDPPMRPTRIGLVVADRHPLAVVVEAAMRIAEGMTLPGTFGALDDS